MLDHLKKIKEKTPLIHCISNIVTANDCANLALALNASPIMAQAPEEMTDIVSIADALVINTGTPSAEKYEACRRAAVAAERKKIPIILDPVGIGASKWRLDNIQKLLAVSSPAVFRVNYSEAKILLCQCGTENHISEDITEHGVDTCLSGSSEEILNCAKSLAQKYSCTVLISGAADIIADVSRTKIISGGSSLTKQITGAGCMLSVLCGIFASVENDSFEAACLASSFWKYCAETAEKITNGRGLGTYHTELINAAGNFEKILTEKRYD